MMEHAVRLSGANKTGDVIGQTRSQARALTDCLLPHSWTTDIVSCQGEEVVHWWQAAGVS